MKFTVIQIDVSVDIWIHWLFVVSPPLSFFVLNSRHIRSYFFFFSWFSWSHCSNFEKVFVFSEVTPTFLSRRYSCILTLSTFQSDVRPFFSFWQFLPSFWFYVFTSCDLMFLCWSRTNQFVLLWSFRPPDLEYRSPSNDFCFELSLIVEERFDLSDDVIKHQRNRRRVNVWRNQCSSWVVILNE